VIWSLLSFSLVLLPDFTLFLSGQMVIFVSHHFYVLLAPQFTLFFPVDVLDVLESMATLAWLPVLLLLVCVSETFENGSI